MAEAQDTAVKRDWKFWMIFVSLFIIQFLVNLELSSVATALPTIVNDLHADQFVWVGSAYAICQTGFVPLSGSFAQTFGRRSTMLGSILLFSVGSALCGAATSLNFLIAGRAVQGFGAGGASTISHTILSDLVPLKDRGVFNGIIALSTTLATGSGPIIGGALAQEGQWRWLFYLNLPVCGVAAALILLFLNLRTPEGRFVDKLRKIDWIGNALVLASTTSFIIALTWGGVQYAWSSARTLVPLILGIVGLGVFLVYETYFPEEPIIPYKLIGNRTSSSGYLQLGVAYLLTLGLSYYLPVFFQACKDATPIGSGVDLFGLAFTVAPCGLIAGISIAITKKYRPQMWAGWVLVILGVGLMITIKANTSVANVVGFSILAGVGLGIVEAGVFFPILAAVDVSEAGRAITLFTFVRNLAQLLGVAIPGAILQNGLENRLPTAFFNQFPGSGAIAYVVIPVIPSLAQPLKDEVRVAFASSLKICWDVLTGITAVGLLGSLLMKGLPLHTDTDKKWGVENDESGAAEGSNDTIDVVEATAPKEIGKEEA